MDHDVKAVANVFYKLAREDKRYLTNLEYQKCCYIAQNLSTRVLGEPLFEDKWVEQSFGPVFPRLWRAFQSYGHDPVRRRLETITPPIEAETPAWKCIRAAWMQFDYEQRHATSASDATARQAGTTIVE